VFLGVLLGGPVILAIALRVISELYTNGFRVNGAMASGAAIFGMMIWLLYIRFIIPILGVFYGTALIADEVEDKTITYLFTRPIPRSAVLIGKFLAYLVCTVLLVLPSVVLVFFLIVPIGGSSIGAAFPSLVKDLGMLAVGLAAYGAVFALVGTRLKRPLVAGLVFAFGWEPAVLLFPGYLKRLTVAYYLQALVVHDMPQDSAVSLLMQVFREIPGVFTSLLSLAIIIGVTVWYAGRTVEGREYVLEQ
jgi:ABC-type transport system involved in multi-copper enzyme maturation permease subunit